MITKKTALKYAKALSEYFTGLCENVPVTVRSSKIKCDISYLCDRCPYNTDNLNEFVRIKATEAANANPKD